ncbi:hypothetical protein EAE96_011493 [Botrytis aclada]|nr:hypothetical protein EAE96_011493 [Botrytis aclada]
MPTLKISAGKIAERRTGSTGNDSTGNDRHASKAGMSGTNHRHQSPARKSDAKKSEKKTKDDSEATRILRDLEAVKDAAKKLRYEGKSIDSPNYDKVSAAQFGVECRLKAMELKNVSKVLEVRAAKYEKSGQSIVLKEKDATLKSIRKKAWESNNETDKFELKNMENYEDLMKKKHDLERLCTDLDDVCRLYGYLGNDQRNYRESWFEKHKIPWDSSLSSIYPHEPIRFPLLKR